MSIRCAVEFIKSEWKIETKTQFHLKCNEMHPISISILCLSFNTFVGAQIFCSDLLAVNKTKFYPVRHCQRSNKTRIAAKNVENLEKCAQFAEHHQGLAFNFGHGQKPRKMSDRNEPINLFDEIREKNKTTKIKKDLELLDDPYFNCEVLDCPEQGNMSTIINDTRYDYYTLYGSGKSKLIFLENLMIARLLAPANASCLPTIGLFMIYYDERMNYTQATITCENHNGFMANVMSGVRTNYLSSLVIEHSTDSNKNAVVHSSSEETDSSPLKIPIFHAFIGLRELHRKGDFYDSNEVPIRCHLFRAWEPKYPT